MITPRIKLSSFGRRQASTDLFVQNDRQDKLGGFIADLAAMEELIDFAGVTARDDAACPRPHRSKVRDRRDGAIVGHPVARQSFG